MATCDESSTLEKDMPLWKKELIQRRKNLAKTIGAHSQDSPPSYSTNSGGSAPNSPIKLSSNGAKGK